MESGVFTAGALSGSMLEKASSVKGVCMRFPQQVSAGKYAVIKNTLLENALPRGPDLYFACNKL